LRDFVLTSVPEDGRRVRYRIASIGDESRGNKGERTESSDLWGLYRCLHITYRVGSAWFGLVWSGLRKWVFIERFGQSRGDVYIYFFRLVGRWKGWGGGPSSLAYGALPHTPAQNASPTMQQYINYLKSPKG